MLISLHLKPCQSLFVAPCSHVWHYRCIRPVLNGSLWPRFLCPNCRAVTDLEAEPEDPGENWQQASVGSGAADGGLVQPTQSAPGGGVRSLGSADPHGEVGGSTGAEATQQGNNGNSGAGDAEVRSHASQQTLPDNNLPPTSRQGSVLLPIRTPPRRRNAGPPTSWPSPAALDAIRRHNAFGLAEAEMEARAAGLVVTPVPYFDPFGPRPTDAEILAAMSPVTPRNDGGPSVSEESPTHTSAPEYPDFFTRRANPARGSDSS